jgi:isoaspartyl peptidase/L-asparaginase-like protein (Ntn-hydrolase superfamily)
MDRDCFVAIHVGAGFHSVAKEPSFKQLCDAICKATITKLKMGCHALDACVYAIEQLEVRSILLPVALSKGRMIN